MRPLARGRVHRHLGHVVVGLPETALDVAGRGGCHEIVAGSDALDLEPAIGAGRLSIEPVAPNGAVIDRTWRDGYLSEAACSEAGDVVGTHARVRHGPSVAESITRPRSTAS